MRTVYLASLILGLLLLLAQVVPGLAAIFEHAVGADADGDGSAEDDGLNLLTIRTLSVAAAAFGLVGLWAGSKSLPALLVLPAAAAAALLAAVVAALVARQLLRFESDASLRLEDAVGAEGQVYLTIPAAEAGFGLIHFELQGRTVELRAVTSEATSIPSGAAVVVVALREGEVVEVLPTPTVEV